MKNPLKKIKFPKIRKPHFFGAFKTKTIKSKVLKYSLCIGLPVILAVSGAWLGVLKANQKPQISDQVNITVETSTRRVYLISDDNLIVPLTVKIDKKPTIQQEIIDVFNLLKVETVLGNTYLRGFIPEETRIQSFEVKDRILNVNFSEELLNYEEKNEVKMLEALTMSFIQFEQVDGVSLFVNDEPLNILPKYQTIVPSVLDADFGINTIFTSPSSMVNKERVTLFYNRNISTEESYLVPVSVYAEKGESNNITFVNALDVKLATSYQLKSLEAYTQISKEQVKSDDKFILNVDPSALIDEVTVNKELYELVCLSLDFMNIDQKVSFQIEGESLSVDGVLEEDSISVNNIVYNSVEL